MDLVYIYGPPAVGKFTVAEKLSALTGFGNFHNHLTVDLVRPLFDWSHPKFVPYLDRLRLEAFSTAARTGLAGLIFTFCYEHPADEDFVRQVVDLVEAEDGRVLFVQLTCDRKILEQRVVDPERQRFRKIGSLEKLNKVLAKDYLSEIPSSESLVIDNSNLSPDEAASQISNHYRLGLDE